MTVEQIHLYGNNFCPHTQRVRIALKEAQAEYQQYNFEVTDRPSWFTPLINPAGQIPAIAYGGPNVPLEQPSPESTKLAESLILLEFIAELFPSAGLLPPSPVERAQVRFFINIVNTKYTPAQFQFYLRTSQAEDGGLQGYLDAVTAIQDLLVRQSPGPYFLGERFSIADASIASFLIGFRTFLEEGIGKYKASDGRKLLHTLLTDEKFARFASYWKALIERPSVHGTFNRNNHIERARKRVGDASD